MTGKIVALVDGSIYSHSVCENAAWVAARTGATIELLHVLGRRDSAEASDLSGSLALGARSALLEELTQLDEQRAKLQQQRGRAILEDARAVIAAAGVTNVTARLLIGDILEMAAESEADAEMIVIGKRGEAADFTGLHLGSNIERIVRASHKPVFVAARAFRAPRRFLIAFDGGASSIKAVEYIAASKLFAGLECRLLMAGKSTPELRGKLDEACIRLNAAGYDARADVTAQAPEAAISELVEAEGIDLLAMGAYGHSHIRNLIIGSTTTEMIRSCKIPVVLFR
ncbi:MAG: universal stress protein [Parvibaculum sp.]|uniref:universal stress protein n=1 Tax=Alphaproteobacteria TaxID=28211 RepID=UPI0032634816